MKTMVNTLSIKRKTKRRTKAQIETDRRLSALRKNLAAEIEADIGRFAGSSQSPMAGLLVMTRVKIILAFLQAFFPMFISPPKPRKVARKQRTRKRKTSTISKNRAGGAKKRVGKTVRSSGKKKRGAKKSNPVPEIIAQPDPSVVELVGAEGASRGGVAITGRSKNISSPTQVRVITVGQGVGSV